MKQLRVGIVALVLGLLVSPLTASAAVITFQFGTQFSNPTLPGGAGPWLTGQVDDSVGSGDLLLTLNTNGLVGTEFITGVYFSLRPDYDPLGLNVAQVSDNTGGSFEGAQVGVNAFQADGDGRYDLLLNFSSNPPRFDDNSTVSFLLSHDTLNLALGDFSVLAAPGGGNGPFYAAAHLQGIAGGGSTWIATSLNPSQFSEPPTSVPEPAGLVLLGMGLLAGARRMRKAEKTRRAMSASPV